MIQTYVMSNETDDCLGALLKTDKATNTVWSEEHQELVLRTDFVVLYYGGNGRITVADIDDVWLAEVEPEGKTVGFEMEEEDG